MKDLLVTRKRLLLYRDKSMLVRLNLLITEANQANTKTKKEDILPHQMNIMSR